MKKALYVTAAFVIVLSLLLCGCHDGQPADPSITASQLIKPTDTTSDVSFYAEVLQDYETIVRFRLSDTFENDWNNDRFPTVSDALILAIQENPNAEWSNALIGMTDRLDVPAMSSFGYILRDINSDDFPELFWVCEDDTVMAIFTNQNGKLVLLDVFWQKHECVITNADELYIRTSSGALYTDYTIQALTAQGDLLKTKQFGFEGISAEGKPLYYEIVDDVKQLIGEDRFDELLRENPFEFDSDWLSQKLNLLE